MLPLIDRATLPQVLARLGHRLTGPRRAILEAVSAGDRPLTVAEIHARLTLPGVNRVTVYRTVHLLVATGLLRVVETARGTTRYAVGEQFTGHRYLLVCKDCGRVEESTGCPITEDEMTRLARQVRRTRQFRVVDHEFRLLGLCRACYA
jgi:Fur family transcriptional regulator, ferric uptake regulator